MFLGTHIKPDEWARDLEWYTESYVIYCMNKWKQERVQLQKEIITFETTGRPKKYFKNYTRAQWEKMIADVDVQINLYELFLRQHYHKK